jgi:hypothetical protein
MPPAAEVVSRPLIVLLDNDLNTLWSDYHGEVGCGPHLLPNPHNDHTPAILARGRECRRVGLGPGGLRPRLAQVVRTLP